MVLLLRLEVDLSCCMYVQGASVDTSAELDNMLTLYPALKGKKFAEWQGSKHVVCIHVGSAAPSGLLPDPAVLFKLLATALGRAGLKGVLLTGAVLLLVCVQVIHSCIY